MPKFYRCAEVAEMLGLSMRSVRRLLAEGRLKGKRNKASKKNNGSGTDWTITPSSVGKEIRRRERLNR